MDRIFDEGTEPDEDNVDDDDEAAAADNAGDDDDDCEHGTEDDCDGTR